MRTQPFILALDQGTTSSRSVVFDAQGRELARAQREFTQHYPQPGWVEHDAGEIWDTQLETIHEALRKAGIGADQLAAIGITNQRETTLLWERASGRPLGPAIVWQDRRTADHCARLREAGLLGGIRQRTGLLLDPYFSATKIAWLLEETPGLRRRAEQGEVCFGTIDSWLLYRLSGGRAHLTDVSNASRTLLFDIHSLAWDDWLLEQFGIPRALLPEVRPSAGHFADSDPAVLGAAVPVTGVAGDQQAALFGQACITPGMAKNTYGTGAFLVMNIGPKPLICDGALTTLAWQLGNAPPVYAMEASIFVAGAAIQWLRDGLGLVASAAEAEELARSVEDSGGVIFVPALTGLGAPHWDSQARGLIIGITRGTTRAHLARAAIEAMAFQVRDGLDAMRAGAGVALRELRVDGGAARNDLLLQFQADLLATPVLRPAVTETTVLGAAALAAVGAGLADEAELARRWALQRRFEPAMQGAPQDRHYREWQEAVRRSLHWARD
jgi:glycerol kinase